MSELTGAGMNSIDVMTKETVSRKQIERLSKKALRARFKEVREFSHKICETLQTEDYVIQSMPDVSPTKWHLAHTSWFFEAFVIKEMMPHYKSKFPQYNFLFNSYYTQVGERWARPRRGLLSRPTVQDVYAFRKYIDDNMYELFDQVSEDDFAKIAVVIDIGLNHEQQHQELIITDIKHVLSINPLHPVFKETKVNYSNEIPSMNWVKFDEGIFEMGYDGDGFFFDNEKPKHKALVLDFQIADRLVTNKEYIEFMEDDGYKRPTLWLSDGIATVESQGWQAPLYWEKVDNEWWNFTLSGYRKVNPAEPVCHVSFYEAEAFARWAGARLATEAEWELAAGDLKYEGNFVENENYHPVPLSNKKNGLNQMYGDVWEWTRSDYSPYPGYIIPPGAIGEYNGKFMSGQIVLRGGSCATPVSHIRNTYRNFFPHSARWQFMGIRLAKDIR